MLTFQHIINNMTSSTNKGVNHGVRGIEYEDNPDDPLDIVPENKKVNDRVSFLSGLGPRPSMEHAPALEGAPPTTSNGKGNIPYVASSMSFQLDDTVHNIRGKGILASKREMQVSPEEFAAGCKLLQAAAIGNLQSVNTFLQLRPDHIHFRDYDRRTALHVAASEGKLKVVKCLVERYHSPINRSDRWGGSPLDDAHRHRHVEVIQYLRTKGASTGSTDLNTNLITAAAEGDLGDLKMLLSDDDQSESNNSRNGKGTSQKSNSTSSKKKKNVSPLFSNATKVDINAGDYDGRRALHLAASAGHVQVVRFLISKGADVNVVDNWGGRPLDDAVRMSRVQCIRALKEFGAKLGENSHNVGDSSRAKSKEDKNLKVEFAELDVIDKIGSGAFGEIFKCRWRGTLVAAKCIRNTKIVDVWRDENIVSSIRSIGSKKSEDQGMNEEEMQEALKDFREETRILRTLRHPNICMLLGYSATENFEVMISELMKCSLLDVFKSHIVNNTKMSKKKQILYAQQLAMGMNYLHQCKPPIIHRDLKPANLLIDASGTLKISDFGLAKVRPDPKNTETDEFRMTGETGSYRFMAPEVFRHEDYTETVDIYSFAMIFYYLLAGRPPWPELNGLKAVIKAATEADRPLINRYWDVQLAGLLRQCWDEHPTSRPSFAVILDVLHDYSRNALKLDLDNISLPNDERRCCSRSCVIS